MSDLIAWIILLALGVAIVGFFMLSSQLENHIRTTTEMVIQSNEMILARLDRLADPSIREPETIVGAVMERRRADRRAPGTERRDMSSDAERRDLPGRRLEDALAALEAQRPSR